jgi:hypothetical protein
MALPAIVLVIGLEVASRATPPKTVHQAEQTAGYILAKAGVTVSWGERGRIRVRIDDSPMSGHSRDAVGFAQMVPGRADFAVISYPAVAAAAISLECDPAELLGAAIAHEVGHLLLGPAHSEAGVMGAHFGSREVELVGHGELFFDDNQAARMRENVRRLQ